MIDGRIGQDRREILKYDRWLANTEPAEERAYRKILTLKVRVGDTPNLQKGWWMANPRTCVVCPVDVYRHQRWPPASSIKHSHSIELKTEAFHSDAPHHSVCTLHQLTVLLGVNMQCGDTSVGGGLPLWRGGHLPTKSERLFPATISTVRCISARRNRCSCNTSTCLHTHLA